MGCLNIHHGCTAARVTPEDYLPLGAFTYKCSEWMHTVLLMPAFACTAHIHVVPSLH